MPTQEGAGSYRGTPSCVSGQIPNWMIVCRSFRAENVSTFVKAVLDRERRAASAALEQMADRFPIAITRDLDAAKEWVRDHARGSERYGLVTSSKAARLKPHAIDVRVDVNPVHFRGDVWTNVNKAENRRYLLNAYRVLLTRARQGMVIFVPPGHHRDATRNPKFYDGTFAYLKGLGVPVIG